MENERSRYQRAAGPVSVFAKTGSLPEHGRIEPSVLGFSRILRRGPKVPEAVSSEQVSALGPEGARSK